MPVCTRICDPSDPFAQLGSSEPQQTKEDLAELFSNNDLIFRGMDFETLDLDDIDFSIFEGAEDSDSDGECGTKSKFRESRSHDCMWGGQCCNREYQRTQPPPPPPQPQPQKPPPAPTQAPVLYTQRSQNKVVTIKKCVQGKCDERTENVVVVTNNVRTPVIKSEGRSLLLNRTHVNNPSPVKTPQQIKREFPTPQSSRPETPQSISDCDSSDDDLSPIPIDSQNTSIFRSALDALSTSTTASSAATDWQDDLLCFGDGRGRRTNPPVVANSTSTDLLRLSASAKSDHNYDGSSEKFENLGIETPSDSEEDEEIDVVSLSERSSSSRSSSCSSGLPTRPTQRDQRHLEEITTSLLSASEAVSRKIRQTYVSQPIKFKRKKYQSESSEDDDDFEDDYEEEEEVYHQKFHRQTKRQKPSGGSQTVRRKKSAGRFSTGGVEEDSQEKRDLHNNMERMRRIDLRNSFEELKALVPAVSSKDRAAKVVILKEAAGYCQDLQAESQSKCMQVMALRKEQERLRGMVSSLRKARAAAGMTRVKMPKRVI